MCMSSLCTYIHMYIPPTNHSSVCYENCYMCRLPIEGRMNVNSTIFFHDLKASFHKLIFCCVKMGKREENSKSELLWKVCLCWTFLLIGSRNVHQNISSHEMQVVKYRSRLWCGLHAIKSLNYGNEGKLLLYLFKSIWKPALWFPEISNRLLEVKFFDNTGIDMIHISP